MMGNVDRSAETTFPARVSVSHETTGHTLLSPPHRICIHGSELQVSTQMPRPVATLY